MGADVVGTKEALNAGSAMGGGTYEAPKPATGIVGAAAAWNCCHRMVRTHRRQESQNLLWASQDFRCGVARPPVARTTRHSPPLASFRTLAAHMRHRNRKVTHMRSASPVRRAVLNMTQRKQVGQSEARRKLSAWGLAARRKRMALSREDLASGQKDLWRLAEDRKDLWISVAAVVGQMDLWRW
eukprot:CAMPEP_0178434112 /NCGR_PEP_ID=MMETSP0689_2-20121128/33256_1 /TAXON_ID=160604 /ORGANISM="Amphidinium massartii, Strain CS-259" /LENGTH=183 /DNA_ID=CAMNT_0020056167 /DNA_START=2237 /DNA_END=2786 /DNA_ORIENTATION=+